jgi:hypothetical protein
MGQKSFFPPNNGVEYRMKIERNGGKLRKLGGGKQDLDIVCRFVLGEAWYDQPTDYSPKTTQVGQFNSYVGFFRCLTAMT